MDQDLETDEQASEPVDTSGPSADTDSVDGAGPTDDAIRPHPIREWWTFSRVLSLVVVSACCAYMLWAVQPHLVLTDTTATGGDMGAHVWGPDFMRNVLIPEFAVTGWTTDWYAGFPAYLFYMVIPSLFIVILDVGIFNVASVFGALMSLVTLGAAVYGIWSIRNHESRLIRFLVWIGCGLGALLLIDIPYNVAFKLIAVSGLVAFPAAVWYLLKALSLRQPGPELGAIASVMFLMDRWLFNIYGGNMASTMAGEFAFSISITLSLFGLGLIANGVRTGRYRARAAIVISLAIMCHVIPGFFFLIVAAIIIVVLQPRASSWKWAIPTGVSAGMMALWWYLPFYGKSAFLNDMGWEKLGVQLRPQSWPRVQIATALRSAGFEVTPNNPVDAVTFDTNWAQIWRYLFPFAPHNIGSQSFTDPNMLHGKVVFALAAVGIVLSLIMVVRSGIFLTALTLITAVAFVVMPQHRFWNARVLPFYYLAIYLLAAIGVVLLVRAVALVFKGRWIDPPRPVIIGVTTVSALVMFTVLNISTRTMPGGSYTPEGNFTWMGIETTYSNPVRGWAKWNFEGLERKPGSTLQTNEDGSTQTVLDTKHSKEFFDMVDMMDRVGQDNGCGRTFWEYGERLGSYGTPMAPMMLPYFTDRCIASMEGLYFEASSTTPFHFLLQSLLSEKPSRPQRFDSHLGFEESPYQSFDLEAGIDRLQMLGVRYYLAYTEVAKGAADAEAAKAPEQRRLTYLDESPWADDNGDGVPDGSWKVYEVSDIELVTPLEFEPVVWSDVTDDIYDYAYPAVQWFNDDTQWDVLRATDGPEEWKRVRSTEEAPRTPVDGADVTVSDLEITQDTISFSVDKTGVPVLIRSSYFPNWTVDGADGVYRVAPNQIVVVPTDNEVELSYQRSGLEWFAYLLSAIGFAIFMYFVVRGPGLANVPIAREFFGDREVLPDPEDEDEDEDEDDGDEDDGDGDEGEGEGEGEGDGDGGDRAEAADAHPPVVVLSDDEAAGGESTDHEEPPAP